jgi:hypothetical protein
MLSSAASAAKRPPRGPTGRLRSDGAWVDLGVPSEQRLELVGGVHAADAVLTNQVAVDGATPLEPGYQSRDCVIQRRVLTGKRQ